MKNTLASWLIRYGLYLMGVGIVAVLYDPDAGQFGFNSAAKTALISGSMCGGLSLVWGWLLGHGHQWARWGAILSSLLFLAAFTWRAIASWMACFGGQPEKWFAASLITCMWAATLGLLFMLGRNRDARSPIESL